MKQVIPFHEKGKKTRTRYSVILLFVLFSTYEYLDVVERFRKKNAYNFFGVFTLYVDVCIYMYWIILLLLIFFSILIFY